MGNGPHVPINFTKVSLKSYPNPNCMLESQFLGGKSFLNLGTLGGGQRDEATIPVSVHLH